MPLSLMTQSCGESCKEEGEYKITLGIESLEMTDENEDDLFEEVLVTIAWDGNVEKITKTSGEPDKFEEQKEFTIHSSSENLTEKLKSSPIMFNLSRGCDDLGSVKLPIPVCVAEAVLCADFNSQTVITEMKFEVKGDQNGKMTVKFGIEKIPCDEARKKLYQTLQTHRNDRKKNERKISSKKKNVDGSDDEVEEDSDEELCIGFKCAHELPDHCKQDLGLNKTDYRIINGNLVNVEDKIGICGKKCPATRKIVQNICKENSAIILSKLFEFKDDDPKCVDLFFKSSNGCNIDCPECGGQKPNSKMDVETKGRLQKNNWIERNLQEEDLLRKLCEKYGIDADEVRAFGEKVETCKAKKPRKKKIRKSKKIDTDPMENKKPNISDARENFIKKKKRKSRGQYSYAFGNEYPAIRSCLDIEKGAGDATVPRYMGWKWDEIAMGPNQMKWFPGRISKSVRCLMKYILNPFPLDTIPLTRRDKNGKILKTCPDLSQFPEFNSDLFQKPTLQVKKRDGEISIILNPLKDNKKLFTDCNPFLDCSPLQFKLKKHPEGIKKHRAKKTLHDRGFTKKCSCLNLECCRCISPNAKKLLTYEIEKISEELKLKDCLTYADFMDSSDSEMDVEFTTPAAVINPQKCKPNVTHGGTQYVLKDFLPKLKEVEKLQKITTKTAFKSPTSSSKAGNVTEKFNKSSLKTPKVSLKAPKISSKAPKMSLPKAQEKSSKAKEKPQNSSKAQEKAHTKKLFENSFLDNE